MLSVLTVLHDGCSLVQVLAMLHLAFPEVSEKCWQLITYTVYHSTQTLPQVSMTDRWKDKNRAAFGHLVHPHSFLICTCSSWKENGLFCEIFKNRYGIEPIQGPSSIANSTQDNYSPQKTLLRKNSNSPSLTNSICLYV